jgi:hypothetical protein
LVWVAVARRTHPTRLRTERSCLRAVSTRTGRASLSRATQKGPLHPRRTRSRSPGGVDRYAEPNRRRPCYRVRSRPGRLPDRGVCGRDPRCGIRGPRGRWSRWLCHDLRERTDTSSELAAERSRSKAQTRSRLRTASSEVWRRIGKEPSCKWEGLRDGGGSYCGRTGASPDPARVGALTVRAGGAALARAPLPRGRIVRGNARLNSKEPDSGEAGSWPSSRWAPPCG